MKIKAINGIMWAADILDGRREFPTFNKKEPKERAQEDHTGAEFEKVLNRACKDLNAHNDAIDAAAGAFILYQKYKGDQIRQQANADRTS